MIPYIKSIKFRYNSEIVTLNLHKCIADYSKTLDNGELQIGYIDPNRIIFLHLVRVFSAPGSDPNDIKAIEYTTEEGVVGHCGILVENNGRFLLRFAEKIDTNYLFQKEKDVDGRFEMMEFD